MRLENEKKYSGIRIAQYIFSVWPNGSLGQFAGEADGLRMSILKS
jgi:hypothetical protein